MKINILLIKSTCDEHSHFISVILPLIQFTGGSRPLNLMEK